MRKAMRWVAAVAVVMLSHQAYGAPALKSGDRWPHHAPRAAAVGGGHVFFGRGNVLTVLDNDLGHLGSIDLQSEILGIFYAADTLYVASGASGLKIVDVSTPAAPVLAGNPYMPEDNSGISSIFVSGKFAYTTSLTNIFTVLDVSDPAAPVKAGSTTLSGLLVSAVSLFVSGTTAAVADQVNGLHLLAISDPAAPLRTAIVPLPGASEVFTAGNYAYVTSAGAGMGIVDISDPAEPAQLGSYAPENAKFLGISVAGDSAFVADENNGLLEVNVGDKNNPSLIRLFAGTRGAYSVAHSGSDIFVCDFAIGLQKIGSGSYNPPGDARDLFIDAEYYLYVLDDTSGAGDDQEGLRIFDVFNIGNFVFKGFVATPGKARSVTVVRGAAGTPSYAYVADGESGLQIVDVSDQTAPVIVGSLDTSGTANDVQVSGNYAYVADGEAGLKVIDISDRVHPQLAGSFDTDGTAFAIVVAGDLVYVADGGRGLHIIDVAAKENPLSVGSLDTDGTAYDVRISGPYAYVADGTEGLVIIDVATPAAPSRTGGYNTDGMALGVNISGNYVRIADGTGGLVTLDISDPAAPVKVDAWSTGTNGNALNVASMDEYVFVAENLAGAAVYQLSDETPFEPKPFDPPGDSAGCFIMAAAESEPRLDRCLGPVCAMRSVRSSVDGTRMFQDRDISTH